MKSIKIITISFLVALASSTFGQEKGNGNFLQTTNDSLSYAMGVYNASMMKQSAIKDIDFKMFTKGFEDAYVEKTGTMGPEEARNYLNTYFAKQSERQAEENLRIGQKFLEENAQKEGVIVDPSGLQYKILVKGEGPSPLSTDKVKAHYHGTKIDGTVFDSSVSRGEPLEFQLNRVIKGWTVGLTKMNVGSKYIFYIPSELGYGPNPRPGGPIQPNDLLIFEVELIEIVSPEPN
jgi:FKBP-type peptidyl-prolyl cis-trans isomerase